MPSGGMLSHKYWLALALGLGLIFATPHALRAQQATASIIGTVTDPQGAIVADAKVTVTNTATKIARSTTSGKDGSFEVISLPIGTYLVTVEHEGFKTTVSPAYTLEINQVLRANFKMEIGTVTETVQVTAGGSVVETVNATLGQSVTSRPLVNLPLNGRNTLDLALLQPGVTDDNPGDSGAGTFNIAGGRADSVTFLLDGGNNNDLLNNGAVYTPNPDAVAEFRILTSNYAAEYGRNAGGIVSVVLKSGSNQLHGSAYDFVRNNYFNANSFFNNRDGLPIN
ncbi:MAG TPA: carboxypeptidase-like regulatory domain-containing protein, partial [Blastocatellia bacterium]|nr:carboxypeptidase-like regulatory domain-containing protein [Blastocatellia bacterium]